MKEKYYCLLLNNHNDTVKHHVSNNEKVSVIRGVIQREVKDLYNLEAAFMDLDEKVTINDNSWFVEGSFPIIATRLKDSDFHVGDFVEFKITRFDDDSAVSVPSVAV